MLQSDDGVVPRVVPVKQVRTIVDKVKVTIVEDAKLPQGFSAAIVVDFGVGTCTACATATGEVQELGLFVFLKELSQVETAVEKFTGVAENQPHSVGFLFVDDSGFCDGGHSCGGENLLFSAGPPSETACVVGVCGQRQIFEIVCAITDEVVLGRGRWKGLVVVEMTP